MINKYYQQELSHLRELAVEFSKAHPALAPMLSGASQDPDVERLLEGTAFLTGMLRQKLDDEFPEVVHGLMSLIFPHYLRPIPATTIVAFTPKPSLMETLKIPAGVTLDSIPVDGTKCTFRTCYDVQVSPLRITRAKVVDQPGSAPYITLDFELKGIDLSAWEADRIRLHVTGNIGEAASICMLLFRYVQNIFIQPTEGGSPLSLNPDSLKEVGFSSEEGLIPYPAQSFPGYRILQEYFIQPQKFLFFDLTGLENWTDRGTGSGFQVTFTLRELPIWAPQIRADNFVLFATPAINIFKFDAEPIYLDHRQPEYRVIPSGGKPDHYQVYSVDHVAGFAPGTVQKRDYVPFELFTPYSDENPVYYLSRKTSPIRPRSEVFLSAAYSPQSGPPSPETLSINLSCTNANLPENLKYGDISEQTSSSPELCEFKNILPPTSVMQPPLGKHTLWRFLSHLSLNYLSLANRENLQVLLRLYVFQESRDKASILSNEKRIDGLTKLKVEEKDRLVRGITMRGQQITLTANPDHFASIGDMHLFGSIMNYFLASYASINCFTVFTLENALTGDTRTWPVRMGDRPLI